MKSVNRNRRCAICRNVLQENVSSDNGACIAQLTYDKGLAKLMQTLKEPGEKCARCGAVICIGCIQLGGVFKCPKCGSAEREF